MVKSAVGILGRIIQPSSPKVITFSISNVYIFVQPNKNGIILGNRLISKNYPTWKIMKLLKGYVKFGQPLEK